MKSFSSFKFKIACILPFFLRDYIKKLLKKRRQKKNSSIKAQLEDLRNILTFNMPINQIPQATGKLRLLQQGNATLLDLFSRRCKEHGLSYWLDFGTLLGAVRHQGFVPWDDDLDVSMMRDDYEKLIDLLPVMFPKEEGFSWCHHAFIQLGFKDTPLNLDITPYHTYCKQSSPEAEKELRASLQELSKNVFFTQGRMNCTDEELQSKIRERILKGNSPLPTSENPLIFLSPPAALTKHMVMPYSRIFPLRELTFEGLTFSAPRETRQFLSSFYGDYMSYPPKVGFWHKTVEDMVKHLPFEDAVSNFIDRFSR